MKKIFLGLLACAGVWACTTDKETVGVDGSGEVISGGTAYLTVRIKDVGTTTRATDRGYGYGTDAEHTVSDAYFYFYDDAGVYVSEAEVWSGGSANTGDPAGNIEFEGETVIVLKGLTTNTYPKYVVTVLNRPAGFTPGETLSVMASKLADDSGVGIIRSTDGTFAMSTSSYVASDETRRAYFVTELTTANFSLEPIDLSETSSIVPVDIYVERLAAKVQVGIGTLSNSTTTFTDGTTGYQLTETVARDGSTGTGTGTTEGDMAVYVKFTGWALNGTAKYSNIVKEIDATWTDQELGFTWNIPTDFRSYWGKSFNYGLGRGQYPTSSGGATDGTLVDTYLDYVNYDQLTYEIDGSDVEYCAENTNTAGDAESSAVLSSKNSSAITNVLLAAVVCDESGNGLNLVRYNGLLFTESAYLNYVMSELTQLGELNVYTSADGGTTLTHIDGSYITLAKSDGNTTLYDGYVVVVPIENMFTGTTFYTSAGVEIEDAYGTVLTTLQNFNSTHTLTNAFTGGLMYYHIPIEHLNSNTGTTNEDGTTVPLEANYGIVRNHWYSLTITSLDNLGKGVYDPDEVIIPGVDDETYYVGADVNILSWKLVNQSVSL